MKRKTLIPKKSQPQKTNVLREGEHTGHAHRLRGGVFTISTLDERMFLRVDQKTEVRHEEHKSFDVLEGEYEIKGVQEFDHFTEEARQVFD